MDRMAAGLPEQRNRDGMAAVIPCGERSAHGCGRGNPTGNDNGNLLRIVPSLTDDPRRESYGQCEEWKTATREHDAKETRALTSNGVAPSDRPLRRFPALSRPVLPSPVLSGTSPHPPAHLTAGVASHEPNKTEPKFPKHSEPATALSPLHRTFRTSALDLGDLCESLPSPLTSIYVYIIHYIYIYIYVYTYIHMYICIYMYV